MIHPELQKSSGPASSWRNSAGLSCPLWMSDALWTMQATLSSVTQLQLQGASRHWPNRHALEPASSEQCPLDPKRPSSPRCAGAGCPVPAQITDNDETSSLPWWSVAPAQPHQHANRFSTQATFSRKGASRSTSHARGCARQESQHLDQEHVGWQLAVVPVRMVRVVFDWRL